jgi:dienelactone hydrolase
MLQQRPSHWFAGALCALCLSACGSEDSRQASDFEYRVLDTTVESRGVAVPVTYVHPVAAADETFPLLVLAHGHGGTRHEAGAFTQIAARLAERGIASIRMDFPGCGASTESFADNNLSNMLEDIRAARDFALSKPNVDGHRVGLHGYSMGARLAILAAADDDSYSVVGTWAPAATNGASSMMAFLGGQEAYDRLKAQAQAEGFAPFTTFWGQDQKLGLRFFEDMENSRPLDAVAQIDAPLLVLYGDRDEVVPPEVSTALIEAAVNSSEVVQHVVQGADHGFGLYTDEPRLTEDAVATTVDFFSERL